MPQRRGEHSLATGSYLTAKSGGKVKRFGSFHGNQAVKIWSRVDFN
ncbi:MAG: hypothetical protein ACI861_002588 [Paracoccaceae bacterium]|jgi:hypothetical protein